MKGAFASSPITNRVAQPMKSSAEKPTQRVAEIGGNTS